MVLYVLDPSSITTRFIDVLLSQMSCLTHPQTPEPVQMLLLLLLVVVVVVVVVLLLLLLVLPLL